ncbi:deoxyuridine 5'-triphosphate nucleotidohydrolase [Anaplasma marginale str. Dawn]|uniref:Deoxyuridine 5'-triphosphate nucleotidohydrolase n=2 Tax=Anaplasma TaxID=768 RepID=D1AUB6_ANACI|nr:MULTISPECIES: dUTP diphosphatase [Anaplasma]ACZ49144.1 deoxyuridine 5'triphosphate nucleotidohydrolase [Anaplasma centrale str. Israel]AGZ78957.1 deoxyuridine 5'-triphosphate nucleotidohydrolase [Anaplasma marginale str. Gypsy Plains]AGZ79777.1 deoxyuridine 5'-triphosphate nucleotidohydrolase [Anaplasma marginale str. Dawn]AXW84164.1 dUTP diphosphatase [Anaplasma marginale]AXW85083.1 dUTP diphosphatase [Anaplasma marginale]
MLKVKILRLASGYGLPLPSYATPKSAGLDLYAAVDSKLVVHPGGRCAVKTGVALELPDGYEAQIRSRSGLAANFGICVLNAPGTIDSDYRGEITVVLSNFGSEDYVISRGDRVAQMVIAPVERVEWEEVSSITATSRGDGGFGSTGT